MGCSLVAPALILALAAALVVAGRLPDSLAIATDAVPLIVYGGGVLFGLLTRRYRLVLGVVVLALADSALVNFGGRDTAGAVAVLLPLNLAVIAWLGREIPLAGRGAALFGMAFLQAGVVALLHQPALASLPASLQQPLVEADLKIWTALSQIAVLAFVMALALALVRFPCGGAPPNYSRGCLGARRIVPRPRRAWLRRPSTNPLRCRRAPTHRRRVAGASARVPRRRRDWSAGAPRAQQGAPAAGWALHARADRDRRLFGLPRDPRGRGVPSHAPALRHGAHEGGGTRPGVLSF